VRAALLQKHGAVGPRHNDARKGSEAHFVGAAAIKPQACEQDGGEVLQSDGRDARHD